MNFYGLLVGLATFIIIGLFHPLVIKAEYYLGAGIWWLFALAAGVDKGWFPEGPGHQKGQIKA